ncbi:hypothetical protein [Muricauda brasiliensis]|uniref:hypothetical protein n=1 Tax=Muricauda brasiliensis TaxID=2162892 RepID=UPI000D3657B6|nr:hypothetical protein [Muricauda brasiliensis]
MKKVILFSALFVLFSCSQENLQTDSEIHAVSAQLPVRECDGYDIFPNEQYDCGWKRGYTDWVYHYNYVAADYDYPQCYKIRVIENDAHNPKTVSILWTTTAQAHSLIQLTQNTFQDYYDDLAALSANQPNNDYVQGQFAGYAAGKGQLPYAPNDEDTCN